MDKSNNKWNYPMTEIPLRLEAYPHISSSNDENVLNAPKYISRRPEIPLIIEDRKRPFGDIKERREKLLSRKYLTTNFE